MEVLITIATHETSIWWASQARVKRNKTLINILIWLGLGTSYLIGDTIGNLVGDLSRAPHATEPHRCSVVLDHKIQPTLFKLSFFPFLSPGQWSQARITRFKQLLSNWQLWNCPSFKRSALELSFFQALNFVLLSYCQLWNNPCHCQIMYWSIVDPKFISNWK